MIRKTLLIEAIRAAPMAFATDILVSEVINTSVIDDTECSAGRVSDARLEKIFRDIQTYHIDLAEPAELANDAGVATLVIA